MAWIKVIKEDEATGTLKHLYKGVKEDNQELDHILTIHSLHPKTLEAHLMMYEELMHGENNLTQVQREMIGVVVSSLNQCVYWKTHHGEGLRQASSDQVMDQIKMDFEIADISEKDKEMLRYSEKLTVESWNITEEDIKKLRRIGFIDVDILDINQIVSYYAYVNRTANGLGVTLEEFWHK